METSPVPSLLPSGSNASAYVVFSRRASWPWWVDWLGWLLKANYDHCYCFIPDPQCLAYIQVAPSINGRFDTQVILNEKELLALLPSLGATEVLRVPWKPQLDEKSVFRGIYSCVSVSAAALGVGEFLLTPWQLRNLLLEKYGGRVQQTEGSRTVARGASGAGSAGGGREAAEAAGRGAGAGAVG